MIYCTLCDLTYGCRVLFFVFIFFPSDYLSVSLIQMGRTLSRVQQALSWSYGEEVKPFKPPLSDTEFHSYLNSQGQLTRPEELRLRIYHGGVEPSLRKVKLRLFLVQLLLKIRLIQHKQDKCRFL